MEPVDVPEDPELALLRNNKQSGFNYRSRRDDEWIENYTLYRDRVQYNRLIQRQTVNIPLMKMGIRTLLKDVDDLPVLEFVNLDNDSEAQVFQNEYWKLIGDEDHNNFVLSDIVDKKQVFFFGRSFDQWQIIDGLIKQTVIDPQDILLSRYTYPIDIHTSRFLIHTHIFTPLAVIADNPDYDNAAVARLQTFHATAQGLIKSQDNLEMYQKKVQAMSELGVPDVESPILGETYVELSLHFVKRKDKEDEDEQIYLYVEADDQEILMKKPLEEVIGVTKDHFFRSHYPYCSWADDPEIQDVWSDAIADILRPANKVLNVWYSQEVENRTLRSYSMNYYNSTIEGFTPQTWTPVPGGWYGLPGKPEDIMKRVDIPDLGDTLDDMKFVIEMSEKATGATTTQQGAQTERKVTLGEVQLALGEAKERIKGMSKFYTTVWKQRGVMFLKLIEAGASKLDAVKIYKKGRNTDEMYGREIVPGDWMTEMGYKVKIWSQDEKKDQDTAALQKVGATKTNMPDNPVVDRVFKRKLLEYGDFTPDETNEAIEFERQKAEQQAMMLEQGLMGQTMSSQPGQMPQQIPGLTSRVGQGVG